MVRSGRSLATPHSPSHSGPRALVECSPGRLYCPVDVFLVALGDSEDLLFGSRVYHWKGLPRGGVHELSIYDELKGGFSLQYRQLSGGVPTFGFTELKIFGTSGVMILQVNAHVHYVYIAYGCGLVDALALANLSLRGKLFLRLRQHE